MQLAALGKTVLVAESGGDRPAVITKVLTNTVVEACAFMPLPTEIKALRLHDIRAAAVNAFLQDGGYHGYWPGK